MTRSPFHTVGTTILKNASPVLPSRTVSARATPAADPASASASAMPLHMLIAWSLLLFGATLALRAFCSRSRANTPKSETSLPANHPESAVFMRNIPAYCEQLLCSSCATQADLPSRRPVAAGPPALPAHELPVRCRSDRRSRVQPPGSDTDPRRPKSAPESTEGQSDEAIQHPRPHAQRRSE